MNDSENLKIEEFLTMLEQMQDQLDLEITERSKAQEKISTLFSENSKLRSELLKKSETIVSLNEKIENLNKSDLQLQKGKEMMAEVLKLQREVEGKVSACNRRAEILDAQEERVSKREEELNHEIAVTAEGMIKYDRKRLEWEFNDHKRKSDQQYKEMKDKLSKKYKILTVTYEVKLIALLIYSLLTTVFQTIKEPVIMDDIVSFFKGLWSGITGLYDLICNLGYGAARIAEIIENQTVSEIVCWVVCIIVIAFGLGFVLFLYGRYLKEHQWDRYTVLAIIADLAITLFFAKNIKKMIPVNLMLMQIVLFLGYSGVRAWMQHLRGERLYFCL